MNRSAVVAPRRARDLLVVLTVAMVATGCLYFPKAVRQEQSDPGAPPWWCAPALGVVLSSSECRQLSAELDAALAVAHAHPRASDALAAGATPTAYVDGVGAGFELGPPTGGFGAAAPDTLLYDGTGPDAQIVGVEWNVAAPTAPPGFAGTNDVWAGPVGGVWSLRAWVVRPFEYQPDVFSAEHPCLGATSAVYDTSAPCYVASHPQPMQVLVTNDDGYNAAGIDAVVEALRTVPGVEVTVVAPATNQSGTGDNTTPGGVTSFAAHTLSGYPAIAVNGFPADSVLHALHALGENPDLVVSGINFGQNIGPFVEVSGTVGAARTAARNGIPALAASQGLGAPADWPSGAAHVLAWFDDFRLGRAGPPVEAVANLNVPTCTVGTIRGVRVLPVAAAFDGRPFNPSDCTSTVTTLADDVDGFIHGFVTQSDVGLG
jgi:5'-nucleotidase